MESQPRPRDHAHPLAYALLMVRVLDWQIVSSKGPTSGSSSPRRSQGCCGEPGRQRQKTKPERSLDKSPLNSTSPVTKMGKHGRLLIFHS